MFFASEDNANILASFLRKADAAYIEDEVRFARLSISREIVGYIYKSPSSWDDRCTFNIKHVGEQYLQRLRDFEQNKSSSIDYIYSMSYRFLCEFDFFVGPDKELSIEINSIKEKVQNDISEMEEGVKSQIIYASYIMPANIAKDFINDANIGIFKDFEKNKIEAGKLKEKWDGEIKAKEAEVKVLKDNLEGYKIGFNFVGLYQGFSSLADKKINEARWLFFSLIFMGVLILSPLIAEIVFSVTGMYANKSFGIDHFIILVPIVSIELILIYFFKIILLNHRSVKAQIIQIELRQTLCQFIQSYADYSSKIKKQDDKALEKFENVIFSGLLSDPDQLPSTFDGLEQIGNLIKSLKNS
ncbi:Uncharacterised protein [Aeromonas salmonicida]|uniref:hypothetical protein n=1 Tax=Aeromonas salmonicida TaxID=645 RepID=UPI00102606A1|nr:hypothetical protein [Aeromonas salmonicida]VFB09266.1 Uncharacterised protein [Aeromonas salmonicida]